MPRAFACLPAQRHRAERLVLRPLRDRGAGPLGPGDADVQRRPGSLLIAALFHLQMNGPAWPDAQPWENYVFAIAAVAVVLLNWKAMLTRDQAVTEVLYPGDESSADDAHDSARPAS